MELASALVTCRGLNVALCLHTAAPVPQPEWETAVAQFNLLRTAGQLDPARARMLVVSDGGAPDTKQRSQLSALWQGRPIKVAVLIPGMGSPLKRGVMTALSWINPAVAYFTPSHLQQALAHVELIDQLPRVWSELQALQRKLPPVRLLRRIAEHAQLPWEEPPASSAPR